MNGTTLSMRNLALFGPPGSGKGTQAQLLAERLGMEHIATGDMLREERSRGTELGQMVSSYLSSGKLVPDEVIVAMIRQRLQQSQPERGFVLDGFPRTANQARALTEMLDSLERPLDLVAVLDVGKEQIAGRLALRAQKEGRDDDSPDIVEERIKVYREQAEPVLQVLADSIPVVRLNGNQAVEEVHRQLLESLT